MHLAHCDVFRLFSETVHIYSTIIYYSRINTVWIDTAKFHLDTYCIKSNWNHRPIDWSGNLGGIQRSTLEATCAHSSWADIWVSLCVGWSNWAEACSPQRIRNEDVTKFQLEFIVRIWNEETQALQQNYEHLQKISTSMHQTVRTRQCPSATNVCGREKRPQSTGNCMNLTDVWNERTEVITGIAIQSVKQTKRECSPFKKCNIPLAFFGYYVGFFLNHTTAISLLPFCEAQYRPNPENTIQIELSTTVWCFSSYDRNWEIKYYKASVVGCGEFWRRANCTGS